MESGAQVARLETGPPLALMPRVQLGACDDQPTPGVADRTSASAAYATQKKITRLPLTAAFVLHVRKMCVQNAFRLNVGRRRIEIEACRSYEDVFLVEIRLDEFAVEMKISDLVRRAAGRLQCSLRDCDFSRAYMV